MSQDIYEKYAVHKPLYENNAGHKGRQSPGMTLMSRKQVPDSHHYIEVSWIYAKPESNPHNGEMVHDFDEILIYWGSDSAKPQVLGAEIEIMIAGQPVTFNSTSGIYIPKGTPHGPITWKKFERPHLEMMMVLESGDPLKEWGKGSKVGSHKPVKPEPFDYEQYVIKSPMRESPGALSGQGRQSPTMTYMSGTQITGVKTYIEFGWIHKVTDTINEMVHDNFEEVVLHIGNDPDNPEALGAEMTFGLGGTQKKFNTNFAMFIPKGVAHGPLIWHDVRRHHIEMAIMLGAGTLKEGWGFDVLDMLKAKAAAARGEKVSLDKSPSKQPKQ